MTQKLTTRMLVFFLLSLSEVRNLNNIDASFSLNWQYVSYVLRRNIFKYIPFQVESVALSKYGVGDLTSWLPNVFIHFAK